MSTLQLEETLRGAGQYRNRNLDLTLETLVDLSDYQYQPIVIDPDTGTASPLAGWPVDIRMTGILQNRGEDNIAHLRYVGVSRVVIGETVTVGQLLGLDLTTGYAEVFLPSADGHVHGSGTIPGESVLLRVTDAATGAGITGLTSSDIEVKTFYRVASGPGAGDIADDNSANFVDEADTGDGWYEAGTTAVAANTTPYQMSFRVPAHPEYIVTPSSHSWTPRLNYAGGPESYFSNVIGISLEAGVADDAILVLLVPQMF